MKSRYTFFSIALILLSQLANAQDPYLVAGRIFDSTSNQALAGASIKIKGSRGGTVTREDGGFQLKTSEPLPFTLIVTSIGYKQQEFIVSGKNGSDVSIYLNPQSLLINQVVVTAS